MAYKAPISKEEKQLAKTVETMQALQRNEFKGDYISGENVEQARDFAEKYLPEMEQMLDSMQSLRKAYGGMEKEFSAAMKEMPGTADKAIVYAGTGAAQVFGIIGSVGSIFSDKIASPKEVVVTLTKERREFFEGMDAAHKEVVGDPKAATEEGKKGTIQVFREAYSKTYFAFNEMVGAMLKGDQNLADQKSAELRGTLDGLKESAGKLEDSLYVLNSYTHSMGQIEQRVAALAADVAITIVTGMAAAKAVDLGLKGIGALYSATSSAGRMGIAVAEAGVETGTAGAETAFAATLASASEAGVMEATNALKAGKELETVYKTGKTLKKIGDKTKNALDLDTARGAAETDFEDAKKFAPPAPEGTSFSTL
ncbi:hypothetical protein JW721_05460 [Candidatus Micrarchaeota archaeon]|nr:hypothetical protein [Candidatus Micrarchaeota archaeon]